MINYNDNTYIKNLLNEIYGAESEYFKNDWRKCYEYGSRMRANYIHYILDYDSRDGLMRIYGYYNNVIPFTKCPFTTYLPISSFGLNKNVCEYGFVCGRLFLINHGLHRVYEIRKINSGETNMAVLTEWQGSAGGFENPYETIHYEVHCKLNKCRKINSVYDKKVNEYNKKWMYIKNRPELKWMKELFSPRADGKIPFEAGKTYYAYDLTMNNLYVLDILLDDIQCGFEPLTPHDWFAGSEYKRVVLNYFKSDNGMNKAGELSETGRFFGSAIGSICESCYPSSTYGIKKEDLDFIGAKCFIVNQSKKIMYCIRDVEKANSNPMTSKISKSIFEDGYFIGTYNMKYNSKTQRVTLAKGNDLPNNEQCLNDWSVFILRINDDEFDNDGHAYYLDPDLFIAYRVKKCN